MLYYNFEARDSDENSTLNKSFEAVSLDVILKEFQYFLKGAGFEFDGSLQIVPEETYHEDIYPDLTITNYKSQINPSYEANHG